MTAESPIWSKLGKAVLPFGVHTEAYGKKLVVYLMVDMHTFLALYCMYDMHCTMVLHL